MTFELTEQAIKEFQIAFYKDKGKRIDKKTAKVLGTRLLKFMKLIYKPIPKEANIAIYMRKSQE